jgi:hypothetical protein
METNNKNKYINSFFKRETYFGAPKFILPLSSNSDSSKCRDFDFNKVDCLWQNSYKSTKINYAKIYPVTNTSTKKPEQVNNLHVCDMV